MTAAAFTAFIVCTAVSLTAGISMVIPLTAGFFMFVILAVLRGFPLRDVLIMAWKGFRDSYIVVGVILLIGCLTGIWRASGTVAWFISAGVSYIPPGLFVLSVFLLTAAMSFAIGTSFGVTATAGVILMSIARASGIPAVPVAGAVMSGVYIGDRGSPASSSANLTAAMTGTDVRRNIRIMLRSGLPAFLVCCVLYLIMSLFYGSQAGGSEVLEKLRTEFVLVPWCFVPAVIMIVLPFLGVTAKRSMLCSITAALLVSVLVQKNGLRDSLVYMITGFIPADKSLGPMLAGGGLKSMLSVCAILAISGSYGGIFKGTGILAGTTGLIEKAALRIGRFPVILILSVLLCMLFCNQTIGIIMLRQLGSGLYEDSEEGRYQRMIETENSVVLIAGMVPWCIACSVPLKMLGVGISAVFYGFYLWLVPLFTLISQVKCRKQKSIERGAK